MVIAELFLIAINFVFSLLSATFYFHLLEFSCFCVYKSNKRWAMRTKHT